MSTAEKVAEHAVNALGGALALMGINVGGGVTIVRSMMGLVSLGRSVSGDPATEARNRAIAATLAALDATPEFARADAGRVAFLLTEANFRNLTPAVLLHAVQTAKGTDIGPPLAAVLTSHLPFDNDDAATVAVVGLALKAAAQALVKEAAFRESLNAQMLMDLVRRHGLQAQFMTEIDGKLDGVSAQLAEMRAMMVRQTGADRPVLAEEHGELIFALAERYLPEPTADFMAAYRGIKAALVEYDRMRAQQTLPSNTGGQIDALLARLDDLNSAGRIEEGARALARAAAEERDLRAQSTSRLTGILDLTVSQARLGNRPQDAAAALVEKLRLDAPADLFDSLRALQEDWYIRGRDGGLNFEAEVAIHLAHATRAQATTPDQRGIALNVLGNAQTTLGQREPGTARLKEAVTTFRTALEELSRDRVPLEWSRTQMNFGNALATLGQREPGTARLEQAVTAYRAALEELPRERVPLGWATMQMNLGNALAILGQREPGTTRLEQAVTAFRAALEERTRERVPLDWALTQMNLGNALMNLGQREPGSARLHEAVAAFRAALEETARDRVPMDWATVQTNLGNALRTIGEREPGTVRLDEAVAAYRSALEEWTRERAPLGWALLQNNLGHALLILGQRKPDPAVLEEAVAAFHAALEERTRERVPLDWAMTQMNLGSALSSLGQREAGTARLEEAVIAFRAALEERTRERVPLDWAMTQMNLGSTLFSLGQRESGTTRLEEAVAAYRNLLEEWTRDRVPLDWAGASGMLAVALLVLAERRGDAGQAALGVQLLHEAEAVLRAGGHVVNADAMRHNATRAEALVTSLSGNQNESP